MAPVASFPNYSPAAWRRWPTSTENSVKFLHKYCALYIRIRIICIRWTLRPATLADIAKMDRRWQNCATTAHMADTAFGVFRRAPSVDIWPLAMHRRRAVSQRVRCKVDLRARLLAKWHFITPQDRSLILDVRVVRYAFDAHHSIGWRRFTMG